MASSLGRCCYLFYVGSGAAVYEGEGMSRVQVGKDNGTAIKVILYNFYLLTRLLP